MTREKIAIKIFPQNFNEAKSNPSVWYYMSKIQWQNDSLYVSLPLSINIFKLLIEMLMANDSYFAIWATNYENADDFFTRYIDVANIEYIRIINSKYGGFICPELSIKFKYESESYYEQTEDIYNKQNDMQYIDFIRDGGKWELNLLYGNNKIAFEDFTMDINLYRNLFPSWFAFAQNFNDALIRDNLIESLQYNDISIALCMTYKQDFALLQIDHCCIDSYDVNKDFGNYKGVFNNIVLHCTGDENSKLVFKNDHLLDSYYISIKDYLEKVPLVYTPMKDKMGNIAIEL